MTIRNKIYSLSDVWGSRACPPQSVFYELEGDSAQLAREAINGVRIPLSATQYLNLVVPQRLVFLGDAFRAASYYPTLYQLTVTEGSERYFASVPVSYNRDYAAPAYSREITDEDEYNNIMLGLFSNGHSTPPQIEVKSPEDAALPDDFYPETSLFHLAVFDMRL